MNAEVETFFEEIRARPKFQAVAPNDPIRAHVAAFEAMLRALYEIGPDNGFALDLFDEIRRVVVRKAPLKKRVTSVCKLLRDNDPAFGARTVIIRSAQDE